MACQTLSATLSITPTTIVSGDSITYTSTAVGGVPTDDGFGHEILIDGLPVYNTGLGEATTMSGTLQITSISAGTHTVISRITDGCLPVHQVATSPPITLTVTAPAVQILDSISYRPSQNPDAPASEGYVEIICTGHGIGSLTTYRDGVRLGTKQITTPGSWIYIDDFGGPAIGFGTWDYSVSDGVVTLHVSVTLNPPLCVPNWVCELPLNGYEEDGCEHRRLNSACNAACVPTWQCRQPLDGYEHDINNCGSPDRLNSACNPTSPITDNTLIWFGVGAAVITTIAYLLRRKNDVKRD